MRKHTKSGNGGSNYHHIGGSNFHHGQQPAQPQSHQYQQHDMHQHHQTQHHAQHQQHQNNNQHHLNPVSHNKYNNSRSDSESNVNHVLLITVINPHYSVTCDLIHQICSPYGKVNRIVIFRKNGVQAMVEFDNIESSKRARSMLNGCEIFSGCCTLRIEYAKPTRLNIHRNDNNSFDYTNPSLGTGTVTNPVTPGQPVATIGNNSTDMNDTQQNQIDVLNQEGPSLPPQNSQMQPQHHQHGVRGGAQPMADRSASGSAHFNQHHPTHQHTTNGSHYSSLTNIGSTPNAVPVDTQSGDAGDTSFHQDGNGFNVSRDSQGSASGLVGMVPHPSAMGPSTSQQQHSNYSGSDSYPTSHGNPPPDYHHQHHGNLYSRQPNDHHHSSHGPPPQHHHHGQPQMQHHSHHQHHHPSHPMPPHHGQHHHHHQHYSRSQVHGPGGPGSMSYTNSAHHGQPANMGTQSTVMMVYGLQSDRINCDRLFNLFCLYGNVAKIKFLRTKEGCAMVQMGDILAIYRCLNSLNKMSLFGNELQIAYSKQPFLHDVVQPFILPDGSPSFKDYTGNKNNRFKNPEVASKNRISPPSQVLHFFNAPLDTTEDELINLFKQTAGHEPLSIKIFTPKNENSKSFSGLATFKSPTEASEALVICNHLSMPKVGAPHPYIFRLCFSPPTYVKPHQQSQPNQPQSVTTSPQSSQNQQQQQSQAQQPALEHQQPQQQQQQQSIPST